MCNPSQHADALNARFSVTMPSSDIIHDDKAIPLHDHRSEDSIDNEGSDPDAEFGGHAARVALEKKLLWKIDLRMSILIVIYILNYVCITPISPLLYADVRLRSTEIMQGMYVHALPFNTAGPF